MHDLVGEAALPQQIGHSPHRAVDVTIKQLVSSAEIVQARFAVGRSDKTITWALAVTSKQHVAFAAVFRERVELVAAKLPLLRRAYQLGNRGVDNIAQQIVGLYIVVAGIEIAVVFKSERVAARRRHDAEIVLAHPTAKCDVEGLHKHGADVAPHPFIEDRD